MNELLVFFVFTSLCSGNPKRKPHWLSLGHMPAPWMYWGTTKKDKAEQTSRTFQEGRAPGLTMVPRLNTIFWGKKSPRWNRICRKWKLPTIRRELTFIEMLLQAGEIEFCLKSLTPQLISLEGICIPKDTKLIKEIQPFSQELG